MRYTESNVFEIARAADWYKLQVSVKKLAEQGYKPLGGIYFIPGELTGDNKDQLAQIMVKYDDEDE